MVMLWLSNSAFDMFIFQVSKVDQDSKIA
jgi:hypothetical protein